MSGLKASNSHNLIKNKSTRAPLGFFLAIFVMKTDPKKIIDKECCASYNTIVIYPTGVFKELKESIYGIL